MTLVRNLHEIGGGGQKRIVKGHNIMDEGPDVEEMEGEG